MSLLLRPVPSTRSSAGRPLFGVAGVVAGVVMGVLVVTPLVAIVPYLAILSLLVVLTVVDHRITIPTIVALQLVLGTVRRWSEYTWGEIAFIDPLLVAPPLLTAVLFLIAVRNGALARRGPLTGAVLLIFVIGLVGAFNPLQGSPIVGLLGASITLTPVAWFWVGRALLDDALLKRTLVVVGATNLVAAVYGIYQSGGFFFAFDQAWIDALGETYNSIFVGGGIARPIGLASSAAEFGKNLGIAVCVFGAIALTHHGRARWLAVAGALVVGTALTLSALRTTTVLTVAALGLMYGVRLRISLTRLVVFATLAVGLMLVGLQFAPTSFGSSSAGVLLGRQVGGISDPLNPEASTVGEHVGAVRNALTYTVTNPVGLGTAATTQAGKQLGTSASADQDIGDVALSWGVMGVVVYLLFGARLVARAVEVARHRRDWLGVAAIGIIAVSALQWFNGGLYSAAVIAWAVFGWLDRPDQLPGPSPGPGLVHGDAQSLGAPAPVLTPR